MPTAAPQHARKPFIKISFESAPDEKLEFDQPFRIGRSAGCELCIKNEFVSRVHAEVIFKEGQWRIRDLGSSNGIYADGCRRDEVALTQPTLVRLGEEGPSILFEPSTAMVSDGSPGRAPSRTRDRSHLFKSKVSMGSGTIVRKYIEHYFNKPAGGTPLSEHSMYVRRAFATVQSKQRKMYASLIILLVLALFCLAGYALYERWQLQRQRAVATDLFYSMKSLDLQIANLQNQINPSNQQELVLAKQYSTQRRAMESNYEKYLAALHVYDHLTEEEKITLRVARIFGETELDMPPDFQAEIKRYIGYWQHSDRFSTAIRTAKNKGYVDTIKRELAAKDLPVQFFYLALQESSFDPYAMGPVTRKGIAKGMWQFIPETATRYDLKLGPLWDLRRVDPGDDRDNYEKETRAAASYLKDLYSTDAQASGLLVMACYNWGEEQVLPLVRSMPANPRDRNFWRLLAEHRDKVPDQTYDYVFYIVSAAVIGENPRLFGFDFDNPLESPEERASGVRPSHPVLIGADFNLSSRNAIYAPAKLQLRDQQR